MSSIGGAIVAHLQTDNSIKTYPTQIPAGALTSETDYAVAYIVLPGEGPIATNDEPSATDTRTERVTVSLMVRSRSYAIVEAAVRTIVRLFDRVSRTTWGTVLIQSSQVIGWQDTPLEPDTSLFQTVVDVTIQYDEVPA